MVQVCLRNTRSRPSRVSRRPWTFSLAGGDDWTVGMYGINMHSVACGSKTCAYFRHNYHNQGHQALLPFSLSCRVNIAFSAGVCRQDYLAKCPVSLPQNMEDKSNLTFYLVHAHHTNNLLPPSLLLVFLHIPQHAGSKINRLTGAPMPAPS